MIQTKEELKRVLELESKVYSKKWYYDLPVRLDEKQQLYKFSKLLRKAEYAVNTKKIYKKLSIIKLNRFEMKYGFAIPLNVLGEGFSINHLGSIIINEAAVIGKNVRLNPGVCIGGNKGKAPIVGDNVYFGPGVKAFGDIKIANGVQIGAGAVATKDCDVEDGIYAGVPAKLING